MWRNVFSQDFWNYSVSKETDLERLVPSDLEYRWRRSSMWFVRPLNAFLLSHHDLLGMVDSSESSALTSGCLLADLNWSFIIATILASYILFEQKLCCRIAEPLHEIGYWGTFLPLRKTTWNVQGVTSNTDWIIDSRRMTFYRADQ